MTAGTLINPKLAAAQVHGGMSMGLGYGLSEQLLFDAKGRPLNDNLLDYKLPTSMDTPDLNALFVELDDPTGPFGNKALGRAAGHSGCPGRAQRGSSCHRSGSGLSAPGSTEDGGAF